MTPSNKSACYTLILRAMFKNNPIIGVLSFEQCGIGRTVVHAYQRTVHTCFLSSFGSLSQAFAEEKVVLEIDHPEIRIAFDAIFVKGSRRNEQSKSINDSYQFSAHLAKCFQMRRLKCLKFTDNRQQTKNIWPSSFRGKCS